MIGEGREERHAPWVRWFSVDGAKLFHFCAGQLPTTIDTATTILFPYFKKEFTPHTPLSLNDKVIRYIVQRHTKQNERIQGLYNNKRGDHVQMNSTIARYTEYCFQLHDEEWSYPNVQSKLICIKGHFEAPRGKQEAQTIHYGCKNSSPGTLPACHADTHPLLSV